MALALRYGTDVSTLRRLNNLPLSELSVQSRAKVYIPGELRGALLFLMHCKGGRCSRQHGTRNWDAVSVHLSC